MAKEQGTVGVAMAKRLSVKELGWDKPTLQAAVLANKGSRVFLARFVGLATALRPYRIKAEGDKQGEIAYGLVGQFEGTSANGEVKPGAVLYLPAYVQDMIAAVLQSNPDVSGVQVAYDVYAVYDDGSATSYTFEVFDLLNTGAESVDEVKASIKALPMPSAIVALPSPE